MNFLIRKLKLNFINYIDLNKKNFNEITIEVKTSIDNCRTNSLKNHLDKFMPIED